MSAKRMLIVLACLGVVAGCGSDPASTADGTEKSFEEALGMDEASQQAREAKVQEAIRTCMKAEGFDYIPVDPSQNGMSVRFGGPGEEGDDLETRQKEGYGITTGFMSRPKPAQGESDDPNQKIREGLSEADRKAYEIALHGRSAGEEISAGGGGRRVMRQLGSSAEAAPEDMGCFGKAQQEVPGGPEELGADLQEMQERAQADPRLIDAEEEWASCMNEAGYTDFEKPRDASRSIMDQMDALMGATDEGDGVTSFAIGGDDIDQAALATLRDEEIALAVADWKCQDETGYADVEDDIRAEYEQRFLDEHPDLTGS